MTSNNYAKNFSRLIQIFHLTPGQEIGKMLHHSDYGFFHLSFLLFANFFTPIILSYPKICLKQRTKRYCNVQREDVFSFFRSAERQPTIQITAMDSFRNDFNVCPKFFNTAETHLVGHDSEHPHRPYSSALSHVLRNCLSLQDCSGNVRRLTYLGNKYKIPVECLMHIHKSSKEISKEKIMLMFYGSDITT